MIDEVKMFLNSTALTPKTRTLDSMIYDARGGLFLFRNRRIFTANATFTPETDLIFLTGISAGANGGNQYFINDYQPPGSGGSGGQWTFLQPVRVTPGEQIAITVGAGNTVFGGYLTLTKPSPPSGRYPSAVPCLILGKYRAYGSSGGVSGYPGGSDPSNYAAPGGAGLNTTLPTPAGNITMPGGAGGTTGASNYQCGGGGGGSPWFVMPGNVDGLPNSAYASGAGGRGSGTATGASGNSYGGAAAGYGAGGGGGVTGGTGGPGILIVEW